MCQTPRVQLPCQLQTADKQVLLCMYQVSQECAKTDIMSNQQAGRPSPLMGTARAFAAARRAPRDAWLPRAASTHADETILLPRKEPVEGSLSVGVLLVLVPSSSSSSSGVRFTAGGWMLHRLFPFLRARQTSQDTECQQSVCVCATSARVRCTSEVSGWGLMAPL